jgi:hypothetical protein
MIAKARDIETKRYSEALAAELELDVDDALELGLVKCLATAGDLAPFETMAAAIPTPAPAAIDTDVVGSKSRAAFPCE